MVGVIVQDVAEGDATTSRETLPTAAEQIEPVLPPSGLQEIVGDKGYHSSQSLVDLEAVGARARAAALHLCRVDITEMLTAAPLAQVTVTVPVVVRVVPLGAVPVTVNM